jgi:hypothetical protein
VQPLAPGLRTLIDVAAMAPVSLAGPRAVTHWPMAKLEELVVEVCEYVVLEPVVTSIASVEDVAGFAGVLAADLFFDFDFDFDLPFDFDFGFEVDFVEVAPPLRMTPSTVKLPDEIWVTFPVAKAKFAKLRAAPDGKEPRVGKLPPFGNVPPAVGRKLPLPRPKAAPGPPAPKPLAVVAQIPPALGWTTMTLVPAIGPLVEFFEAGFPVTVTQSPTATSDTVEVTVWVKVVEGVQLTVTCPVSGFWTSIELPVTAATLPDAPGIVGRVDGAEVAGLLAAKALGAAASVASAMRATEKVMRVMCRLNRRGPLRESRFESDGFIVSPCVEHPPPSRNGEASCVQLRKMSCAMVGAQGEDLGSSGPGISFVSQSVDWREPRRPACRVHAEPDTNCDRYDYGADGCGGRDGYVVRDEVRQDHRPQ